MAAFFFASPIDIDIKLEGEELRNQIGSKAEKDRPISCPVYYAGEWSPARSRFVFERESVRHTTGSKSSLWETSSAITELFYDRGHHQEFLSLSQEVAAPGDLRQAQTFDFMFKNVEKQYESYLGINVKLRKGISGCTRFRMPPDSNNSIKMEVGIEDCLHIEFEYNKSKYHLKDVIVGKIYFLLVRIKIKHMELSIIRRETTGSPPNQYNESETITKFEIMDGAPVRGILFLPPHCVLALMNGTSYQGETIPIRLFLGGTRYYLNLVLIDEENRRYFKQQEITIFRIPELDFVFGPRKSRDVMAVTL
ncbi:vacuolar protein sorting-associated protein 26 [Lactarius pseudohatsudake]|nr:vacuolar protein sorting-associated protein 26 [Lactarius pseudohatsudake]